MSWYRTGTISLTNGSKNVTGTGTLFVSNVKSGFALLAPDFSVYEVDNISSDTAFTLKENYRGTTVSSGSYAIFQTQGIIKDLTDEVTTLINTFGAFRDAYTNGELVGTGLEIKGILNSTSELPSSPSVEDVYLIGTYLYVYSGTVGGWKNSNIAGIIPKGAWNASTAYSVNDTVTYSGSQYRRKVAGTTSTNPDSDTTNWELFVSIGNTGPAGITPRGIWNSSTAYVVNDTVQYNGSQYRRIVAGTTSTDPSSDTTNWELFVSRGLDGAGSVTKVNSISPDLSGNVTLTSDNVTEGSTNLWFTPARVRSAVLTGLSTVTNAVIDATDSVLSALGKLQAQVSSKEPAITAGSTANTFWANDKTFKSPYGPIGRFYSGSDQGGYTSGLISYDTTSFTSGVTLSGRTLIPNRAGYYKVSGHATFITTSTGAATFFPIVLKNGTSPDASNQYDRGDQQNVGASSVAGVGFDSLVYLNGSTDYVAIYIYCGAALQTLYGGSSLTSVNIQWVHP